MTNRFKNISSNISNIKKYFVTVLAGIEVFVLSPRLKCPLRLLSHLAVLWRGRPGRADLRLTSALTLGSLLASPQLLADLVCGVARGPHH